MSKELCYTSVMSESVLRAAVRVGLVGRIATAKAGLLGLTTTISACMPEGKNQAGIWTAIERVCVTLAVLEFDLRTLDVDADVRQSLALVVHAFVDVAGDLTDAFGDVSRMEIAAPRFLTAVGLLKKTLESLPDVKAGSPARDA